MTPASEIIKRCGGFATVADWLGLDRSGVQRWTYEHPKGTGERVPTQHWASLIRRAREAGVTIELHELVPSDAAEAASESQPGAAA